MGKLLRETGAEVVTSRDGEEALGYLLQRRFDVLLTDLQMPTMSGFELIINCEKLPATHRPTKIIAISGEYGPNAIRGHAVGFLNKPVDLNQLLQLIGGLPN